LKVKGCIVNVNNRLNGIFNSFDPFSNKFSPRNRFIDVFSSYSSFYLSNRECAKVKKAHLYKLDKLIFYMSVDPKTTIVTSDASIKNQVTTSIAYIYIYDTPIVKMIHHAINIEHIVVITDSIYITKKHLTLPFIYIRFRHYLSLRDLESFSEETTTIFLNFGTA